MYLNNFWDGCATSVTRVHEMAELLVEELRANREESRENREEFRAARELVREMASSMTEGQRANEQHIQAMTAYFLSCIFGLVSVFFLYIWGIS